MNPYTGRDRWTPALGPRAGQSKLNSNVFAARLRRELKKAGVTRHELHVETATTLPGDFHSCRRAFATAAARVGMNEQQAMMLTGHWDAKPTGVT